MRHLVAEHENQILIPQPESTTNIIGILVKSALLVRDVQTFLFCPFSVATSLNF